MLKEIFVMPVSDWDGESAYSRMPLKGTYSNEDPLPGHSFRYVRALPKDENGNERCPFCGNNVEFISPPDKDRNTVQCSLGHVKMRSLEAWNTRI